MLIWKLFPILATFRVMHTVDAFRNTYTSIGVSVLTPIWTPYVDSITHQFMSATEPFTGEQFLYSYMVYVTNFLYLHLSRTIYNFSNMIYIIVSF